MQRNIVIAPRLITPIVLSGLSVLSLNMILPSLPNIATDFAAPYALVNPAFAGYAGTRAVLQVIFGSLSEPFWAATGDAGRTGRFLLGLAWLHVGHGCLDLSGVSHDAGGDHFRLYNVARRRPRCCQHERKGGEPARLSCRGLGHCSHAGTAARGPPGRVSWLAREFLGLPRLRRFVLALCWIDLRETNLSPSETLKGQIQSYPELVRSRRFWGYALCMAFSIGAFYAFLGGAPLVASALFDVPPALLGAYMGSITAGFVLGSCFSGYFAARHSLTTMMIGGRIIACLGLILGLLVLGRGGLARIALVWRVCLCRNWQWRHHAELHFWRPIGATGPVRERRGPVRRTDHGGGSRGFGRHWSHLDFAECGLRFARNDALVFSLCVGGCTLCASPRPTGDTADFFEPVTVPKRASVAIAIQTRW